MDQILVCITRIIESWVWKQACKLPLPDLELDALQFEDLKFEEERKMSYFTFIIHSSSKFRF